MTSVKKGHPVVVYGRLRVNQWETREGRATHQRRDRAPSRRARPHSRTSVEFSRAAAGSQLDTNDRLADPAIQDTFHGGEAGATGPTGPTGRTSPVCGESSEDSTDEGVVVRAAASARAGSVGRVEDADTDDYVVVNGG